MPSVGFSFYFSVCTTLVQIKYWIMNGKYAYKCKNTYLNISPQFLFDFYLFENIHHKIYGTKSKHNVAIVHFT